MDTWAVILEESVLLVDGEAKFIGNFSTLALAMAHITKEADAVGCWTHEDDYHTFTYIKKVDILVNAGHPQTITGSYEYVIYRAPLDGPIRYS